MKNIKPFFEFYNPNTEEKTAETFIAVLVAANAEQINAEILHRSAPARRAKASTQARASV